MRRRIVAAAALALTCLTGWLIVTPVAADTPIVLVMDVDGPIKQLTADQIARGLDTAHADGVELVIIRLNSPGGLFDPTRLIVQDLLDSEVPVAVYVSPAGAYSGSAGTFIVAAAHFAVMAPAANVGAVSPLEAAGDKVPGSQAHKVSQDMRAYIRGIAEVRGRNADALEDTVWKATAYSAHEAQRLGVIDLVAADLPAMLDQLDGRQTTTAAGPITATSRNAIVRYLGPTILEHLLGILTMPEVVFVLFVTACLAFLVEVLFPGLIIPSLLGVVTLALAVLGFLNLPGSWLGVVFIVFAAALFYGETTVPGFGFFGAGGVLFLVLGGIFLFGDFFRPSELPEPSFAVNPIVIAVIGGIAVGTWLLFVRLAHAGGGETAGFQTAADTALVGRRGVTLSDLRPSGRVRIDDRDWVATADPGVSINRGEQVRVRAVYGAVLKVERS
ncbi:MAG: nodulation protein NfeD [Chloroflexi bacterium]|nr:nodulation protein NfeD [Chloroflexota bacterium]